MGEFGSIFILLFFCFLFFLAQRIYILCFLVGGRETYFHLCHWLEKSSIKPTTSLGIFLLLAIEGSSCVVSQFCKRIELSFSLRSTLVLLPFPWTSSFAVLLRKKIFSLYAVSVSSSLVVFFFFFFFFPVFSRPAFRPSARLCTTTCQPR